MGWNREKLSDPAAEASALQWSVTAMSDAVERLPQVRPWDTDRAFAVISEMVWWVTIVDATLVRHHPDTYDAVLAGQAQPERGQIEGTLSGLRFVRNRMGQYLDPVDFVQSAEGRSGTAKSDGEAGGGCVMAWVWRTVPEPEVASLPPRGQAWEMTRFRSYGAQLAGHTVGETFERAAAFLKLAAAEAAVAESVANARSARPAVPAT